MEDFIPIPEHLKFSAAASTGELEEIWALAQERVDNLEFFLNFLQEKIDMLDNYDPAYIENIYFAGILVQTAYDIGYSNKVLEVLFEENVDHLPGKYRVSWKHSDDKGSDDELSLDDILEDISK